MDSRFRQSSGFAAFTGNELLLKGALEAGVHLFTGYPGSPVADVFDACEREADLLSELGMLAQLANNEALAAARLNGAQQAGLFAVAVMKSVGFHVAADALATGTLGKTGHRGGALVVVGDDPWSDTTQVPADSRRLSDHLFLPVLEPSTFQEIKDWVGMGLELSRASDLYVCLLLTTYLAEGGGTVRVRSNRAPEGWSTRNRGVLDSAAIPVDHTILLPPHTARLEEEALRVKLPAARKAARALGLNRIFPGEERGGLAFVAAGASFAYLQETLREVGLEERWPVLKLGLTFPLDPQIVKDFLVESGAREVLVVEEKRRLLETRLRDLMEDMAEGGELSDPPRVYGKRLPGGLPGFPEERGLSPAVVFQILEPLFRARGVGGRLAEEAEFLRSLNDVDVRVPERTATFCPGCPHRDSSSVFLELVRDLKDPAYMQRRGRKPVDILFHGDAGCYSMLFLPPNGPLMHNYSGMGLGGGTGAGMAPFTTNKSVGFIGDSTFFHSGWVGISDSLKNGQDILYVILDNKTTAMTGHQPHPGMDRDLMGNRTFAQDVLKILEGLVGDSDVPVARVNPEHREEYRKVLEEYVLMPGVKFVVADKECGITYHRRKRQERRRMEVALGYLPEERRIQVHAETCELCRECTRLTGCPGLTLEDTLYGPKMATDPSTCVSDAACARIKACPAFEEVIVSRRRPPPAPALPDPSRLPEPPLREVGECLRLYLAGVGGMGIGSATAVLVRAGVLEGLHVAFGEKKGIAIRNGGVYSHVTLRRREAVVSPLLPQGKADVLLGFDVLEAARGLDPRFPFRVASRARTATVVNSDKTPTVRVLTGEEDFNAAGLMESLRRWTKSLWTVPASRLSLEHLGNKQYLNTVVLGVAYQRGLLPFRLSVLEQALKETFGREAERNLQAFHLGRDFAHRPETYREELPPTPEEFLAAKLALLSGSKRAWLSRAEERFRAAWRGEPLERIHFVQRAYDLLEYGGIPYAERYALRVERALWKEDGRGDFAAARAIVRGLHKVMAIKDEVEVARLLTHPEKYERDRRRLGVDPARGDRVRYRHFNRPRFDLPGGLTLEFDLVTRDWMLRIMRRFGFLRRLLPRWHRRERDFRDWYEGLVDRYLADGEHPREVWIEVLRLPEGVRGFREVRYPAMDAARRRAEELLGANPKAQ